MYRIKCTDVGGKLIWQNDGFYYRNNKISNNNSQDQDQIKMELIHTSDVT